MNILEEANLMKQSREDVVEALNELGFTDVNNETPLSEIAEYMKWAGSLRDVRLAVLRKSDGKYFAYSQEEWNAMAPTERASMVKIGVHLRAERTEFIIAKDDAKRYDDSVTMPWGPTGINIKGMTNFGENSWGSFDDADSEANTNLILAQGVASGVSFEAAERARAYKASTYANDGYNDPTTWSLPALRQLLLMYKYRLQINSALMDFFGSGHNLVSSYYWSSTSYNSSDAWFVYMTYGGVYLTNRTLASYVRPVAVVPSSAIRNT